MLLPGEQRTRTNFHLMTAGDPFSFWMDLMNLSNVRCTFFCATALVVIRMAAMARVRNRFISDILFLALVSVVSGNWGKLCSIVGPLRPGAEVRCRVPVGQPRIAACGLGFASLQLVLRFVPSRRSLPVPFLR